MNIFITGGTSGIGLSLVSFYAKFHHVVGTCSLDDDSTASKILPENVIYYCADVTDSLKMENIIHDFKSKVSSLDLVIANAGINIKKSKIPDFKIARKVMEINILGVMNTLSPTLEIMNKQKSGHIVGIGSISGLYGMPGMSIYGSSKAAIINMFESFSIDLPKLGIDVTCVIPGFIATPLTKDNKHKMPFIMSIEEATDEILWAIKNKKKYHVFPKILSYISFLLSKIPRKCYRYIMSLDFLGFTKE